MKPYQATCHDSFSHDSIDSLGYDWERIANPDIAPRFPFKIYLPLETRDVVQAVRETRQLNQSLVVRGNGHSSNDLVLPERGSVLCLDKFNRILNIDDEAGTVTVQSGRLLIELDDVLAKRGFGLPIVGDHDHITAGGFASVGGISAASHLFGMFVDNVQAIEYVTPQGEVVVCGRNERPDEFRRVLAGRGRHGIITTLTLDMIRVDKHKTVLENHRRFSWDVDTFIRDSYEQIANPGNARMERSAWIDFPFDRLGRRLCLGQLSRYTETKQTPLKIQRERISYRYLHTLGYWGGRLPEKIDLIVKALGMIGTILVPRYSTISNIERFSDRVIDYSVGEPTRMFVAFAPVERYSSLFRRLYDLFCEFRERTGCFSFLMQYVKAVNSPYLAGGGTKPYALIMLLCGMRHRNMTPAALDSFVSRMDDICIEEESFRYMHSRTVKDAARLEKIDPNEIYRLDRPHQAMAISSDVYVTCGAD
jgi:hypothetical protein